VGIGYFHGFTYYYYYYFTRRVGTTTYYLIILLLLLYARYLSVAVAAATEGQSRVRSRYLLSLAAAVRCANTVARTISDRSVSSKIRVHDNNITVVHLAPLLNSYCHYCPHYTRASTTALVSRVGKKKINTNRTFCTTTAAAVVTARTFVDRDFCSQLPRVCLWYLPEPNTSV